MTSSDTQPAAHTRPVDGSPSTWRDRHAIVLEGGLLVLALFVFGRSPVLFLRQRLLDVVDVPVGPIWQDDPLIRTAFVLPALAVCGLAARRLRPRDLLRHLLLLAILGLAVVSVAWSVEPSVTQLRSLMFLTTAGVGWHLGSRFTLAEQLDIVIATGAVAVGSSIVALVAWPEAAKSTNGVLGEWSGVYVNRNLFALVLCTTLLAVLLRWGSADRARRLAMGALAVLAVWLLWRSGARTGPVSLAAAVVVIVLAILVRQLLVRRDAAPLLSAGAMLAAGVAVMVMAARAEDLALELLGREPTLTRRTDMWRIDRDLIAVRPWRGWGFEAIWAHQPAIDYAAPRFFAYPYQAHDGYYEMALSLGRIGLFLLLALIVVTLVRAVALAWADSRAVALWPLGIATFAVAANISESLFVANEVLWALFVSAGVAAVVARRDPKVTRVPGAAGAPGSPAARSRRSGPT